jgi:hypothetical protein
MRRGLSIATSSDNSEAIAPAWTQPDTSTEDVPRPRTGGPSADYRNFFDTSTIADLERSAASGAGVETLYGAGDPPPPSSSSDGGDRGDGRSPGLLALIGVGFLAAAANQVINDSQDGSRILTYGAIGTGLILFDR